jgi:hypothetical protein
LAVLSLLIAPALADSLRADGRGREQHPPDASSAAIDPCAASQPLPGARHPAVWRTHLTRDTAVYMVKHLQLACRRLNDFVQEHREILQGSKALPEALSLVGNLRAQALGPIYRAYPDLRAKDLTGSATSAVRDLVGTFDSGSANPGLMSRTTALRLHPFLTDSARHFSEATGGLADALELQAAKALVQEIIDITAEIGFANAPIYKSYPDLWQADARKSWQHAWPRAPDADDHFRNSAPPPGTTRLSESAMSYVRKFLTTGRAATGQDDAVAAISWTEEQQWKGPNDADWHRVGAGLSLGAYPQRQVPADVIQTIDGLRIILSAPDPSIFVGKVIDYQDGKFQLREP